MIPTVPGSEMVSTPTSAVKLDVGALEAPLRAKMKLAQAQGGIAAAIGEVGQKVGDFGMKMQQAKNFSIMADADRAMRQEIADFQESLPKRTDEDKWTEDWKQKTQALKEKVYSDHKPSGDLKRELDNQFANWSQSTAIEVKTVANKKQIARFSERHQLDADLAAQHQDEQGIDAALDPMALTGAASPEDVEKLKAQYKNKSNEYAAKNYIMTNPGGAVDFIMQKAPDSTDKNPVYANFPLLTADQRNTLRVSAEAARSKSFSNNADLIKAQVDQGDQVTEEYLQTKLENKEIGQSQVIGIRAYLENKAGKVTPAQRQVAGDEVAALIAKIPRGESTESRSEAVNKIYASPAWNRLNTDQRALWKKQIEADTKPNKNVAITQQHAQDERLRGEGFFYPITQETKETRTGLPFIGKKEITIEEGRVYSKAELMKMDQATLEKKFGKGTKLSDVLSAEDIEYGKYRTLMTQFEQKNPDATAEQLAAESARLRKPYVLAKVQKTMGIAPQKPTQSNQDTMRVKSPDGKVGTILKSKWEAAKAMGYTTP
jgi:hypothetical protein